jgi:hypothetical protein
MVMVSKDGLALVDWAHQVAADCRQWGKKRGVACA